MNVIFLWHTCKFLTPPYFLSHRFTTKSIYLRKLWFPEIKQNKSVLLRASYDLMKSKHESWWTYLQKRANTLHSLCNTLRLSPLHYETLLFHNVMSIFDILFHFSNFQTLFHLLPQKLRRTVHWLSQIIMVIKRTKK